MNQHHTRLDIALPLADPKDNVYKDKNYRQKGEYHIAIASYAYSQNYRTIVLISQDCLTIPFDGRTPKNDHPFSHPSFFIIVAKRESVKDGANLGVQNNCELWLGDDDDPDEVYRLIIDDYFGIIEDYLIFNSHGYDGSTLHGSGITCIHKRFAHPNIDVFTIAKNTPPTLDQEISVAWAATHRSNRIESTLFFPPGYISVPFISVEVRVRTPTCSVERLAMYHQPSSFDPRSVLEEHEDDGNVVHPRFVQRLKANLLYSIRFVQGCFTYQET